MNLRMRLMRMEKQIPNDEDTLRLAWVDSNGRILDDGSVIVRPWIGRHYRELPSSAKVIMGVDPGAV